jgi:hypothetical protein
MLANGMMCGWVYARVNYLYRYLIAFVGAVKMESNATLQDSLRFKHVESL